MDKALTLLKRYRSDGSDSVSRGAMRRGNTPRGPASAVLDQYRGMDGVLIPVAAPRFGLASWDSLDELRRYRDSSEESLDLICVIRPLVKAPDQLLLPGFDLLGFDCGVIVSRRNIYSVIFHEVLFGKLPQMVQHAAQLNARCLFDEWQDAASLMAVRDGLSEHFGHALEKFTPDDDPGVVAVFEAQQSLQSPA
jgi:hypothetical protein